MSFTVRRLALLSCSYTTRRSVTLSGMAWVIPRAWHSSTVYLGSPKWYPTNSNEAFSL